MCVCVCANRRWHRLWKCIHPVLYLFGLCLPDTNSWRCARWPGNTNRILIAFVLKCELEPYIAQHIIKEYIVCMCLSSVSETEHMQAHARRARAKPKQSGGAIVWDRGRWTHPCAPVLIFDGSSEKEITHHLWFWSCVPVSTAKGFLPRASIEQSWVNEWITCTVLVSSYDYTYLDR